MQHYCLYPSRGNGSTHELLAILGLAQRGDADGNRVDPLGFRIAMLGTDEIKVAESEVEMVSSCSRQGPNSQWLTLPETNSSPMEMPIFPGKYPSKMVDFPWLTGVYPRLLLEGHLDLCCSRSSLR